MTDDRFAIMRRAMVASQLRTTAVDDPRVIEAMGRVPREAFVPTASHDMAYVDVPVPLGDGRALNAPMVTARLLNAAAIGPDDAVLIVGAATGYAMAVAALLARHVTGVESDAALAKAATAAVPGTRVVVGPLEKGAARDGPYDVIIIDGAVEHVPQALIDQLAAGGRLATALVEDGVTRLAIGRAGGAGFGLVAFADAEAVILPGFARPRIFAF